MEMSDIIACQFGQLSDIIAREDDHPHAERRERSRCPSRDAREQVEAGLNRYAVTGQGDVKALQGRDGYRLRIGGYRVIFDEDVTTILAIYIGRRATTTYKRS
jgi:mRNA interferase RelE/StbE